MKKFLLNIIIILVVLKVSSAQESENVISKVEWRNVILKNFATFRTRKDLEYGAAFLLNYNTGVIACTARDFTGTLYTPGKMLLIKDFDKEVIWWKMYLPDDPSKYILMDSLVLRGRIEKSFSIFTLSRPFLTFALKNIHRRIIPLEPDVRKIRNQDTVYIVGYDNNDKLKINTGVVETTNKEKYADESIRIKTNLFLNDANFVGSPIIDKDGKAIGVFNRAYRLKIDDRGRIISNDKLVKDSHFDYFIEGTSMRAILGKDYRK